MKSFASFSLSMGIDRNVHKQDFSAYSDFFFLIEAQLIYSVVSVSGVQQVVILK